MANAFWDERYASTEYAYGREPNDFLVEHAARIPRGRVLCLAEGEGRNAVYLASLGHEVTAVDFSREGVRKTEQLARERGVPVTAICADLATYEVAPESYAGVVSIFAHLPPAVRKKVHGWVSQALVPGGALVLEAYRPEQLALNTGGPRDASLLMTLDGLEAELSPLVIEVGRNADRTIQEGAWHSGPSATVQVVARKRS